MQTMYTPFAFFDFVNDFVRDHPKCNDVWTLLSDDITKRNSGIVPIRLTALDVEWYKVKMNEIAFKHIQNVDDSHTLSFMLVHVPRNVIFYYKVHEETDYVEQLGRWSA
jgi:hypothetical protein